MVPETTHAAAPPWSRMALRGAVIAIAVVAAAGALCWLERLVFLLEDYVVYASSATASTSTRSP